jgi:RNA polymerase sigma-70 factor (ECF subfamily)
MNLTDSHVAAFEEQRGYLHGVAYRMLGSVSDAEDMVQETWLRWAKTDPSTIETPRAWLVKAVSRLCLDRLKSARVQREQYYGTWLPEPLVEASSANSAQVDESVSIALLLVLEKLSPVERAGFLLHDVFGYSFDEIADILEKPEPACRKLVSRARTRVREEKPRFESTSNEHEELLLKFLEACRGGDLEPLLALLEDSAALYSDGGGKASAVPRVLLGREEIARFFLKVIGGAESKATANYRFATFNGAPGMLLLLDGKVVSALSLEIHEGRIAAIFAHRNPDKLEAFD